MRTGSTRFAAFAFVVIALAGAWGLGQRSADPRSPGSSARAAAAGPSTAPSTTRPASRPASRPATAPSRAGTAKQNVAQLEVAVMQFELDVGRYPTTAEGLKAIVERPKGADGWHGPYVQRLINDPWGHPYQYRSPGKHNPTVFDLWSAGPDGRDGTGDDIGNW